MGLRYSANVVKQLLYGVVSMKESTTYQEILREGRQEGWQEGRQEGRREGQQEGRQEGYLAEARRIVFLLGENRFGPPDLQTRTTLESIDDVVRLENMSVRVLRAKSWADLLNLPSPRRRNGRSRRA
jgi:predicted transposase YdaD